MIFPLSHEKESIIPTKLISEMRNGNVFAWVGAGLSVGVGYPTWPKLVSNIADNINRAMWSSSELQDWAHKNAAINPEWVAEVLCSSNIREYYEAIKSEFGIEKNNESITHAILALLPFKGYITTNYDTLIETNVQLFTLYRPMVYNNSNAIELLTNCKDEKFIYKIHGDINSNIEDIILTESDFFALQKNGIFNKVISWIFSQHSIVCMGYSLRDRDFRMILEERYQLFKGNCPPIYAFISINETCIEEVNCYRNKYNLHVVPISPEYEYAELTSTLLSLYCLYHKVESSHNSQDIVKLITERKNRRQLQLGLIPDHPAMEKTHRMISVIKDGLEVNELVSLLSENNIDITSAHVELLCKFSDCKNVICEDQFDSSEDRVAVANHIKKNLDVIPIDDNPRFLSSYYKRIINKYSKTLIYLLGYKESWSTLIENNNDLKKVIEYFKQQGLWNQWLMIAKGALEYCGNTTKLELLRSIAWINFWTRDYDALKNILEIYPKIDSESGVNNYASKLHYMTLPGLNYIIEQLENKVKNNTFNYFDISLLGRAYARLSIINPQNKERFLEKAESRIKAALDQAMQSKDLIEIAVQNWYLSLILIDRGKVDEAKFHLAETKRLDENIMERKPGIAWLRVAEYRMAMANNESKGTIQRYRNIAYEHMNSLGMKKIDSYLDDEYYF